MWLLNARRTVLISAAPSKSEHLPYLNKRPPCHAMTLSGQGPGLVNVLSLLSENYFGGRVRKSTVVTVDFGGS